MRPLVRDERGVRFQCRVAILHKDGFVKLYRADAKDPVASALRNRGPIREVGFIEQSHLLITTSDDSVKIWDAFSGTLRKELDGEVMRPLCFTSISTCAEPGPEPLRFATVERVRPRRHDLGCRDARPGRDLPAGGNIPVAGRLPDARRHDPRDHRRRSLGHDLVHPHEETAGDPLRPIAAGRRLLRRGCPVAEKARTQALRWILESRRATASRRAS